MKRLILGLGNDLLTDDGIGIYIAEKIKSEISRADIICSADSGFGLLDHMLGYDQVILIDSIITGKTKVGEIHHFSSSDFSQRVPFSIHSTDIISILEYSRKCGFSVPNKIEFLAVEIEDNQTFNESFSDSIESQKDQIVQNIKSRINNIINNQIPELVEG
ncbi:MAG: hydrogenase maturation protease [Candidatus Marinimicrobia bacterium]|nr:hydrogenase maturation protease [Candidatus Neomarinimicrobiota bacterium]